MNRIVSFRALAALVSLVSVLVCAAPLRAQDPGTPVAEQNIPLPPPPSEQPDPRDPAKLVFPKPSPLIETKPKAANPAPKVEDPAELELYQGETRVIPVRHAGRLAIGNGSVLS